MEGQQRWHVANENRRGELGARVECITTGVVSPHAQRHRGERCVPAAAKRRRLSPSQFGYPDLGCRAGRVGGVDCAPMVSFVRWIRARARASVGHRPDGDAGRTLMGWGLWPGASAIIPNRGGAGC